MSHRAALRGLQKRAFPHAPLVREIAAEIGGDRREQRGVAIGAFCQARRDFISVGALETIIHEARAAQLAPHRCKRCGCINSLIQENLSSGFFICSQFPGMTMRKGRISAVCAAQTHAPGGRAAVATWARSFSAIAARSPTRAPAAFASLTPARWPAGIIGGEAFGPTWGGGCVLARNSVEQAEERLTHCNYAAILPVLAVLRFWGDTDVRAHTRAYMCEGKAGTREQTDNPYRLQRVGGSFAVLWVFSHRTGGARSIERRGVRHILAGGYARGAGAGVRLARIRGQNHGTGGDSFRVFAGRAARIGLELVQLRAVDATGRNGGFLRFSEASSRRVGRMPLEGWAQDAVSSGLSGVRRQPSRLRAAPGGLDRPRAQATPLCPHSPSCDPLSCWHARLAGFGTASGRAATINVQAGQARRWGGRAKSETGLTGRGRVLMPTQAAKAATGRGGAVVSGLSGTAPGWICNARAGGARVN